MINSRRVLGGALIFLAVLMARIDAYATENPTGRQDIAPPATLGLVAAQYRAKPLAPEYVLSSMASLNNRTAWAGGQQSATVPQEPAPRKQRSIQRKVFGAIVGATGGFFGGAYLGAVIEGDCNCDDPGLRGAVIGAPIGAAVGGILGYKFLF